MYQRDIPWETYLDRYGYKPDLTDGLQRASQPPQPTTAAYASAIAAPEEIDSIVARSLDAPILTVDTRTVTPESLRASFDWPAGSVLWRAEMQRPSFEDLVSSYRSTVLTSSDSRARADRSYLEGRYAQALSAYQVLAPTEARDFSLYLSLGHLYLYHQRPANLERAQSAYLKAADLCGARLPVYAARSMLLAAFTAYLRRDDNAAIDLAQQALQFVPQLSEAWYTLARAAAAQRQPNMALPALDQAMRLDRNYALRAARDPDFTHVESEIAAFFEKKRAEAREQADAQGRSLKADLDRSPLPHTEQAYGQRQQAEIADRWTQDTYFGYMDAISKVVRLKVYADNQNLGERDRLNEEAQAGLSELEQGAAGESVPALLRVSVLGLLDEARQKLLPAPSTLEQAQAAVQALNTARALWQMANGQAVLSGHTGEINALSFSPDGRLLVSAGSWDQSLRLWNAHTGELVTLLNGHNDSINHAVFSPDGELIASAGGHYKGNDFSIRLWNPSEERSVKIIEAHTNMVPAVAFQPHGDLLASISHDWSVRLWTVPDGDLFARLDGHQGGCTCLAFDPSGQVLATGGEDQAVRLWDAHSTAQTGILLGHEAEIRHLAFSPDGKTLVSGADDGTLRVWDVAKRQLRQVVEMPGRVTALAAAPDSADEPAALEPGSGQRWLAWATSDGGTVQVWNTEAESSPLPLEGRNSLVTALAFSADGMLLASGDENGCVRLWDADGKPLAIRGEHAGRVSVLAFSPKSSVAASGGRDKSVRLWGLVTTEADRQAVAEDEARRTEQAEEERRQREAAAEAQRQAWRASNRCEVCGQKLGIVDRLGGQTRCKEHRLQPAQE